MKPARFTTVAIVALVALRLGCGWLFYREGSKKLDSGAFHSEGFLRDAKGPLAGMYLGMVPDVYGHDRLNPEYAKDAWKHYYIDAGAHFDFGDDQLQQAERAYNRALAKLKYFLEETGENRQENLRQWQRVDAAKNDPSTADVDYRSTWIEKEEKDIDKELTGWLREADAIAASYEKDINDIAREGQLDLGGGRSISQYDYYGAYALPAPGATGLTSSFADVVIPWFTFAVGALLVLGLFTRVAALAGSAFLLSVVASQPPFVPAASDTNYQIVLLLGLLVVAAVGAGRWGGLDFFLSWCWGKCCGGRRTRAASDAPKKA